jgi:hypothetical protein
MELSDKGLRKIEAVLHACNMAEKHQEAWSVVDLLDGRYDVCDHITALTCYGHGIRRPLGWASADGTWHDMPEPSYNEDEHDR